MPSLATIYVIATTVIFSYTLYEHLDRSDTYFKALMTYLADQSCLFILYNMILTLAILLYCFFSRVFFLTIMEGEVIKITDKLKNKIVDLIILAYIIDLKFDFEMYMLVVFVIFSFILHNHLIFRSEYLVHVYNASASLDLHYRAVGLYLVLFFIDFQILKFIFSTMFSATKPTEGLFVYYMVINSFSLLEPFLQFAIDFYEKYTFHHIKNSDELVAKASIFLSIPRLLVELLLCIWISWKLHLVFFGVIRGFEIISNIKKTYDSYCRIKKLSQTMTFLKKIKGQQLAQFHDLTCTVCYEDMKESVLLPCRHIFHQECIRQWIIKNLNHFCPKCKHELNFENAESLYETKKDSPLDKMRTIIEENNRRQPLVSSRDFKLRNFEQHSPTRMHSQYEGEIRRDQRIAGQTGVERSQSQLQREEPQQIDRQRVDRERVKVLDRQGRNMPIRQYIIDRPDLSEYPLEVYESLRRKILPIGSLPYGAPTVAVPHRNNEHMLKREEYIKEMETISMFLNLDRNLQMMLL